MTQQAGCGGLLPSEWINWGESCPERLAGEEGGGVFDRGKSGQAFLRLHPDHPSPLEGDLPAHRRALAKAWARWGRARGKERAAAMRKARTGFDSRLLTWSRIGMGCSKSDLSGCRGPLPPLPLLTKEGSEKPQKLPTRFDEDPKIKNS